MFRPIGGVAAGMVAAALEKHRLGEAVTLADKIPTLASADEIEGFVAEISRQGTRLTDDERSALWARRQAVASPAPKQTITGPGQRKRGR